jgi:hypothetical protein
VRITSNERLDCTLDLFFLMSMGQCQITFHIAQKTIQGQIIDWLSQLHERNGAKSFDESDSLYHFVVCQNGEFEA